MVFFRRKSCHGFWRLFSCLCDFHGHKDLAKKTKQFFLTEVKVTVSRCFSWCPEHLPHVSKQLQTRLCKGGSHNFSEEGKAAEIPDHSSLEAKGSVLVSAVFESHHEQALFLIFYNQNGLG